MTQDTCLLSSERTTQGAYDCNDQTHCLIRSGYEPQARLDAKTNVCPFSCQEAWIGLELTTRYHRRRDSVVSIVTRLRIARSGVRIPAGASFLYLTKMYWPARGPKEPPIQWVLGDSFQWVKQQGSEADHLPPPSMRLRMGGNICPLHLYAFLACIGTNLPLNYPFSEGWRCSVWELSEP